MSRNEESYWSCRLQMEVSRRLVVYLAETLEHGQLSREELFDGITDLLEESSNNGLTPVDRQMLEMLFDKFNQTPVGKSLSSLERLLEIAIYHQNSELIRFVIDQGAKPNKNIMREICQCQPGDVFNPKTILEILEMLLEAGGRAADIYPEDLEWMGLEKLKKSRKLNKLTPAQVVAHIRAHLIAEELES
jgi:hypothetical protein